jgi:hypothetical protein
MMRTSWDPQQEDESFIQVFALTLRKLPRSLPPIAIETDDSGTIQFFDTSSVSCEMMAEFRRKWRFSTRKNEIGFDAIPIWNSSGLICAPAPDMSSSHRHYWDQNLRLIH